MRTRDHLITSTTILASLFFRVSKTTSHHHRWGGASTAWGMKPRQIQYHLFHEEWTMGPSKYNVPDEEAELSTRPRMRMVTRTGIAAGLMGSLSSTFTTCCF